MNYPKDKEIMWIMASGGFLEIPKLMCSANLVQPPNNHQTNKTLSKKKWNEDWKYLFKKIEKMHQNCIVLGGV